MKTPTSSESGYFNPRVFVAFLLWACGGWLAAISLATPASAWRVSSDWGTPGSVYWNNGTGPITNMGDGSSTENNFQLSQSTTVTASTATYQQYVSVHIHSYWWSPGNYWRSGPQATQYSGLMYPGQYVTVPYTSTRVNNNNIYWTMLVQVTWYNSSNQPFASRTFYPNRGNTLKWDWVYDPNHHQYVFNWWGNTDLACAGFASRNGYCTPGGLAPAANLNTPTGSIYCLYASHP